MIHRAFGTPQVQPDIAPRHPDSLEQNACYRYCEAVARSRHHNFPVASFFVPRHLRKHIWAIYAFARAADDFADEPQFAGRRSVELDRWEERLEAAFHGEVPDHPVFIALADTARRFELPITPFSALLSGFRSDLETRRYATHQDLRSHTALAAEPVGQLYLYLTGYRDPALLRYVGDLASALAFANFWQDLAADLDRGRLYLPTEDLNHFGVSADDLMHRRRVTGLAPLVRYEVARTRALFERARPLVNLVGDDIAVEMAICWHGGMRILDKIHSGAGHILDRRPRLTAADKAYVVSRALAWRGGSLGRRAIG